MSRTLLALLAVVLATSACGFKRPLIRPANIPKYERDREERMRKFDERDANAARSEAVWEEERQQQQRSLQRSQPGGTALQDSLRPPVPVEP